VALLAPLRRLSPIREPQSESWEYTLGEWAAVHSTESQNFAFRDLDATKFAQIPTLDVVEVAEQSLLVVPETTNLLEQDSEGDVPATYDARFELLWPVIYAADVLGASIAPPPVSGSTFVTEDKASTIHGRQTTERTVRPFGHSGVADPKSPRGYDIFAMLLPILMPPAASEFHGDLLFPQELYDFQRAGVSWLFSNDSALLADDMGLGKTVQAITAFRALIRRGLAMQALVLCPKSLLTNWTKEIERWAPELVVRKVHGPSY
jgi:hypothetical protein